jgi:hypothetical protein
VVLYHFQDLVIAENVDDLLIRLDEFEHLLEMAENDWQTCQKNHLPVLKKKYSGDSLTNFFRDCNLQLER